MKLSDFDKNLLKAKKVKRLRKNGEFRRIIWVPET